MTINIPFDGSESWSVAAELLHWEHFTENHRRQLLSTDIDEQHISLSVSNQSCISTCSRSFRVNIVKVIPLRLHRRANINDNQIFPLNKHVFPYHIFLTNLYLPLVKSVQRKLQDKRIPELILEIEQNIISIIKKFPTVSVKGHLCGVDTCLTPQCQSLPRYSDSPSAYRH